MHSEGARVTGARVPLAWCPGASGVAACSSQLYRYGDLAAEHPTFLRDWVVLVILHTRILAILVAAHLYFSNFSC